MFSKEDMQANTISARAFSFLEWNLFNLLVEKRTWWLSF